MIYLVFTDGNYSISPMTLQGNSQDTRGSGSRNFGLSCSPLTIFFLVQHPADGFGGFLFGKGFHEGSFYADLLYDLD